ncbi:MAG: hypothetical protein JNJ99_02840, partial [Crocinitomicaceae bacterium]|nr:hypothetical protein [Crocinitomicaceae bacterium]
MKQILFSFLILSSLKLTFAQPDSADFNHVFYNENSMYEYVFGQLPDSLFPTGFLIDRVPDLSELENFLLSDNQNLDTLDIENWFKLNYYIERSKLENTNLIHYDTIGFKMIDRYLASDPDANFFELPIIALDYKVNKFKTDAVSDGHILFTNDQFIPGVLPQDGIEENELFFAGFYADTIDRPILKLEFDPYFIQSNRSAQLIAIQVFINGDTTEIFSGEIGEITNFKAGKNIISFNFIYNDQSEILSHFEFFYLSRGRSVWQTNHEENFFDVVGTIINSGLFITLSPDHPSLTYGVLHACNNTSGKIWKPVIFVSGFGMAYPNQALTVAGQKDCVDLYESYNIEGLMTDLRSKGYDVVVVRFIPAVADITKNAALLEQLIHNINAEKLSNNSNFENIIIGYSSGSMAVRYTLDMMEKKHLENAAPHHHSKLYISFEGEHEGAYVPVGTQAALNQFLAQGFGTIAAQVIHYMANSPQAKQLLKYYWMESGFYGTSYTSGQGPHQMRTDFLNDMENPAIYGHDKQWEKHGYYGYPAFTRNVSISNGSRFTTQSAPPVIQNTPYLFDPGHLVFEHSTTNRFWQVKFGDNSWLNSGISPKTAFKFVAWNQWGTEIMYWQQLQTNSEYVLWGNSPGGFLYGEDDMQNTIFKKMNAKIPVVPGWIPGTNADVYNYLPNCFTPIVATHGIRNFNLSPSHPNYNTSYPYHVIYDFQDNDLMNIGLDLAGDFIQSDFYGYPVVGHSSDHFSITPFEALYCDEWNQTHISSLDAVLTSPAYPDEDDMGTQGYVTIKTFIMDEIEPTVIHLQNQKVGWNTNGAEYKAQYEASYAIFLGENVSPKTDIAPYEIWNNGSISCVAEEHIT